MWNNFNIFKVKFKGFPGTVWKFISAMYLPSIGVSSLWVGKHRITRLDTPVSRTRLTPTALKNMEIVSRFVQKLARFNTIELLSLSQIISAFYY